MVYKVYKWTEVPFFNLYDERNGGGGLLAKKYRDGVYYGGTII